MGVAIRWYQMMPCWVSMFRGNRSSLACDPATGCKRKMPTFPCGLKNEVGVLMKISIKMIGEGRLIFLVFGIPVLILSMWCSTKNVCVYYNNSILYQFKPHASHIVLEHNELRHRKIKKNHSTHFFSSPKKIPPQVASRRTLMPPSC